MTREAAPPSIKSPVKSPVKSRSAQASPPPSTRKTPRKTETPALPVVAFLGLGAMGAPMAANLVRKGFSVTAWNRDAKRSAALGKLGAKVATTPRECVLGADVIVTMLSDAAALFDVLGGDDGILAGMKRKALVIEMSTSGRAAAKEAARMVEAKGGALVDAPVSGTTGPAERGELVAMVGGKLRHVARAEPVLRALCKRIIHAGNVGQGQALKVILNGLGAHHFVAFASMLALGERAGLARDIVVDAFTSGAFASPSYIGKRAKVLARDYTPEFSLALSRKDAALNLELQEEVELPLPVTHEIVKAIDRAIAAGLGELDLYAIEKYFAREGSPREKTTPDAKTRSGVARLDARDE
jgi:3-hydroxyisobutyrate dehydrogenase-like beta-hydroxyacid dehydrogenase